MKQKRLIEHFVTKYNSCQPYRYRITKLPDEDKEKSAHQPKSIDAIASSVGGPALAIEHTHVVNVPDQKKEASDFRLLSYQIEEHIKEAFPFRLSVTLPPLSLRP